MGRCDLVLNRSTSSPFQTCALSQDLCKNEKNACEQNITSSGNGGGGLMKHQENIQPSTFQEVAKKDVCNTTLPQYNVKFSVLQHLNTISYHYSLILGRSLCHCLEHSFFHFRFRFGTQVVRHHLMVECGYTTFCQLLQN